MQQFKEYLEEEGLPPNDDRLEFVLPTFKSLGSQKLKILRLPPEMDFKRSGPKPALGPPSSATCLIPACARPMARCCGTEYR